MKTEAEMNAELLTLDLQKSKIEIDEHIVFFSNSVSMVICRITEVREKAVKVDYCVEGVSPGRGRPNVTVFEWSCFIPVSVIDHDKYGSLTVKKWFANKFQGGHRIKRYFIENEKICYC